MYVTQLELYLYINGSVVAYFCCLSQSLPVCVFTCACVKVTSLVCVGVCVCVCMHVYVCLWTSFTMSGVIMHYPARDQCFALSSSRVLLFNVINVTYAWLHMRFVSRLMLTVEHHQCLPAMSQHLLMTPVFSSNHHVENDKHCLWGPTARWYLFLTPYSLFRAINCKLEKQSQAVNDKV